MNDLFLPRKGATLPEIAVVLVIIGVLMATATPAMSRWVSVSRVHTALDQISGELYRARMLAVESGEAVTVVLRSNGSCINAARTRSPGLNPDTSSTVGVFLDVRSVCLQHSGDSILTFNARGMLKPPTRSIYPVGDLSGDSLLISIAGRLRRNY